MTRLKWLQVAVVAWVLAAVTTIVLVLYDPTSMAFLWLIVFVTFFPYVAGVAWVASRAKHWWRRWRGDPYH